MNYTEIGKEYPKASKRFLDSLKTSLHLFNDRDLYDFFDKQEVHIQISVKCAMDDSIWYSTYIWTGKVDEHLQNEATRIKAEEAAFRKAFFILENKLKS